MLSNVDRLIKGQVNTQMRNLNYQFPDSVPPLDAAIAIARTKIRERNMDPFRVPDITRSMNNGVVLRLYNGTFKGLASLYRCVANAGIGDVIGSIDDRCHCWSLSLQLMRASLPLGRKYMRRNHS